MNENGISVVMPVLGKHKFTKNFFESFLGTHPIETLKFEFIVVNNGQDTETKEILTHYKNIIGEDRFILIENEENVGVCKSWNQGVKQSQYPYVCIVNNDIQFMSANVLQELQNNLKKNKNIYWTSPATCYSKDLKKRVIRPHHFEQLVYAPQSMGYVVGCCFMIPKKCFDEVGLFDEGFDMRYYEDLDYINRILQAHKQIRLTETALVYHAVGITSRTVEGGENNEALYNEKWGNTRFNILKMQGPSIKAAKHFPAKTG